MSEHPPYGLYRDLCTDYGMQWKRNSPATGSWSIRDELRRVRSRATEQMLNSLPSPKIDLMAVESKKNVDPSAIENNAGMILLLEEAH